MHLFKSHAHKLNSIESSLMSPTVSEEVRYAGLVSTVSQLLLKTMFTM